MSANVVLELALLKEKQNINIDAVEYVLNGELTEQIQGKLVYLFICPLITVMCRVVSSTVTPPDIRRYCMTSRDKSYLRGVFHRYYESLSQ